MIDFFDNLYQRIQNQKPLLIKIRYYSLLRFTLRTLANIVLPVYFRSTQSNPFYRLKPIDKSKGRVIVSFTSFPKRIGKVWMVVESILRQTKKPDRLILWLSKEQFPTLRSLPLSLLRMQSRGLEIVLCDEDIRSHKKYYYVMKEFPDDTIITIDDDLLYNSCIVEYLLSSSAKNPHYIIANHAKRIAFFNKNLLPYSKWKVPCRDLPDSILVQIGIGGVLYPPHSLHQDVISVVKALHYTPMADDIWLFVMARLIGNKVVKSNYKGGFLPIQYFSNVTLSSVNNGEELNDKQIKSVRKYYIETLNIDPFASS